MISNRDRVIEEWILTMSNVKPCTEQSEVTGTALCGCPILTCNSCQYSRIKHDCLRKDTQSLCATCGSREHIIHPDE